MIPRILNLQGMIGIAASLLAATRKRPTGPPASRPTITATMAAM